MSAAKTHTHELRNGTWSVVRFAGKPSEKVISTHEGETAEGDAIAFAGLKNREETTPSRNVDYFKSEQFFQSYKQFATVDEPAARDMLKRLVLIVRGVC